MSQNPAVEKIKTEYLTTQELADALKISKAGIRHRISIGYYQKGVHFIKDGKFNRFIWGAIEQKMKDGSPPTPRRQQKPKGVKCLINI